MCYQLGKRFKGKKSGFCQCQKSFLDTDFMDKTLDINNIKMNYIY